jgi:hypothetical protein
MKPLVCGIAVLSFFAFAELHAQDKCVKTLDIDAVIDDIGRILQCLEQKIDRSSSASNSSPESAALAAPCPVNNTPQCALPLISGQPESGDLTYPRERYYRFRLEAPTRLQLLLKSMPTRGDVHVSILDSEYKAIAKKWFKRGQPGSVDFHARTASFFYVKLHTYNQSDESYEIVLSQ